MQCPANERKPLLRLNLEKDIRITDHKSPAVTNIVQLVTRYLTPTDVWSGFSFIKQHRQKSSCYSVRSDHWSASTLDLC